jgi:DNA-directed RNA polymerase alpha subunit
MVSENYIMMFQGLSLNECIAMRDYLTRRIRILKNIPKDDIENLDLSVRAYNVLKAEQLHTIPDLVDFGVENIGRLKNAGSRTVKEIVQALERFKNTKAKN